MSRGESAVVHPGRTYRSAQRPTSRGVHPNARPLMHACKTPWRIVRQGTVDHQDQELMEEEAAEPEESPRRKPRAHRAHFLAISRTLISCHDALKRTTCAPFRRERSMKFTEATKFHRKSGEPRSLRKGACRWRKPQNSAGLVSFRRSFPAFFPIV